MEERIKGYENALTEAGVPIDRSLWFTEILVDNPVERATAFLQANPDMTGLFAMNAYAGRIAYLAAKRLGKRMPEDFSISSFDLENELELYPIFTAKQESYQMGERAVELLQAQLNGETSVQRIVLPVKLCIKKKNRRSFK